MAEEVVYVRQSTALLELAAPESLCGQSYGRRDGLEQKKERALSGNRIGIVGSGPMAVYLFKNLIESKIPVEITVFEATDTAGRGMPYREGMNADYMLCNAFSREIPNLTQSLYDWLKDRPARELSEWELSSDEVSPRAFYPRILLGEFLQSEFEGLCARARNAGHDVTVHTGCRVTDVVPGKNTTTLKIETNAGAFDFELDCVVVATGHDWPDQPTLDNTRLVSPWPYSNITELPPAAIGVLGSSLSAVDVVIALGHAHGRFEERGPEVRWTANPGAENLRVTMVSHMGIMPEGDFYYPYPYQPLKHITAEAVRAEIEQGSDGLLARVFEPLIKEIEDSDPGYLESLGPDARTITGFARGYFAHRQKIGGLEAVRENFAEARASMRRQETVGYRYALLRGHEEFGPALRHLADGDWDVFMEHLMPVFGDCYAAVPHLSLARILAMDKASVLDLLPSGKDAGFRQTDDGGVEVGLEDRSVRFAAMIDARGQSSASLDALPFPSLVTALENAGAPLTAPFRLSISKADAAPIYCLAMPQLLERYPFSQGLPNCAELAKIVADDVVTNRRPAMA